MLFDNICHARLTFASFFERVDVHCAFYVGKITQDKFFHHRRNRELTFGTDLFFRQCPYSNPLL